MKKLLFIASALVIGFSSCRGPAGYDGLDGAPGPAGQDGGLVYASAFELILDFTPANGFEHVEPYGFDVYPADVVLVYIKWDDDDVLGPIWRPLNQTAYLDQGILTYEYDFGTNDNDITEGNVRLYLGGNIADFSTLDGAYLNDQLFRVVVVPAEFLETARLKSKSYEDVTAAFGIEEEDFIKRDLTL
ncbi:hypothetical protein [uncultured Arcticibacterium sp.]|uniref:hypothetical protein n=1 Tax=uncultured Arcticibacterium sp. TaxID=2173042 RepID=UPI0030F71688